ncbi:MAG: hypothetical protein BRD55_09440 [Bacteroidetes bacterium SW_9_63_38]|nr:MAG: hypothetical protein BRD55_09440 [Bacteroidetes bacterium SW_9_63_38]
MGDGTWTGPALLARRSPVRRKSFIHHLGVDERIGDLLISSETQYHLIRTCERHEDIFICTVITRNDENLGPARRKAD